MDERAVTSDDAPTGRRDYNEFAFRELRRARKAFGGPEADNSEAEFAVQIAHVAALLDVAEAIRGRGSVDGNR